MHFLLRPEILWPLTAAIMLLTCLVPLVMLLGATGTAPFIYTLF